MDGCQCAEHTTRHGQRPEFGLDSSYAGIDGRTYKLAQLPIAFGVFVNGRIERTTILAVYSAFVAACYLAGYWSRFDVNIFQFAGLTGFASLALYPLMTAVGLNVFFFLFMPTRRSNKNVSPTASKGWFPQPLAKGIFVLWWTLGPAAALAAYILMTSPYKWLVVLLGIVPFIHQVAEQPIAEGIALDAQRRKDILYWAIAFPLLAALAGGTNAQTILDGKETRIIVPTGAAKNLQTDENHPIAFLGFAGGTYFLYESKTGNVVMMNQAVAEPLTIQPRLPKSLPVKLPTWLNALLPR